MAVVLLMEINYYSLAHSLVLYGVLDVPKRALGVGVVPAQAQVGQLVQLHREERPVRVGEGGETAEG